VGALHCLRDRFKRRMTIAHHEIRAMSPDRPFDLVMCRNLAFTYFDLDTQRAIATVIADSLRVGGALVLGAHEELPADLGRFEPWDSAHRVYRRLPTSA
jgi:chemotaxis protein methyltransferase CheR